MRILFDQGTPVPISGYLTGHVVGISADLGWDQMRNGELLAVAEQSGFELLLTTDKNLRYQQNLAERTIAEARRGARALTMASAEATRATGCRSGQRGSAGQLR